MSKKVVIIDYGLGNLFSVKQACETCGFPAEISSEPKDILEADALLLPGVGAFGQAVANLEERGLSGAIRSYVESGRPFFGVCLGLQLLFDLSDEFGEHKGLSLVKGSVVKFPATTSEGEKVRVPNIGWNKVVPAGQDWLEIVSQIEI